MINSPVFQKVHMATFKTLKLYSEDDEHSESKFYFRCEKFYS